MLDKRSGLFVGGLLVGSAIGTAIGLLIAPRTGQQTRKLLKKSADALPELVEDLSTSVQLQADRLSESALENWEETLDKLKEAISAGVAAYSSDRQTLSQPEAENHRESHLPPREPVKRLPQQPNSAM